MGDDFHTTDLGNAYRLVKRWGMSLRYVHAWEQWLSWAGTHWQRDEDGKAERCAKDTVKAIYDDAAVLFSEATELAKATSFAAADEDKPKAMFKRAAELMRHAKTSEGAARIAAMLSLAQSELGIPVAAELLDEDGELLNSTNGTLDLRTMDLRKHNREDLLTFVLPYEFKADASLEMWDNFLEAAVPDPAAREFLQRAAGASLRGDARDDVVLLQTGVGGSGKSTFQEALKAALGPYGATAPMDAFVGRRGSRGGADPDIAALRGKRAAFVPEAGTGGAAVELLKQVTGGDTMRVRELYRNSFEMKPTFTLWLRANHRPMLPDDDSGLRRRLVELPFKHAFTNPDRSVRDTLLNRPEAWQAVMAWAVKGVTAWRLAGLDKRPTIVNEATAEFWDEMNPLSSFYGACCIIGDDKQAYAGKLYAAYQNWVHLNGEGKPLSNTAFGKRLMADARFTRQKNRSGWLYLGIGLLEDVPSAGFVAKCDGFSESGDGFEGRFAKLSHEESEITNSKVTTETSHNLSQGSLPDTKTAQTEPVTTRHEPVTQPVAGAKSVTDSEWTPLRCHVCGDEAYRVLDRVHSRGLESPHHAGKHGFAGDLACRHCALGLCPYCDVERLQRGQICCKGCVPEHERRRRAILDDVR